MPRPLKPLSEEERIFCEMLYDKIEFFEFFWSEEDRPWESRDYQSEMLLDENDRLVCCSGRSIGKTSTFEGDITYTAIPGSLIRKRRLEGLLAAPNDVH